MPAPPAAAHEETGETTKAGYPKEHFGHGHEVCAPGSGGLPFSPLRCTHVSALTCPGCLRRGSRLVRRAATSQVRPEADACIHAMNLMRSCLLAHALHQSNTYRAPSQPSGNSWWQALQLAMQFARYHCLTELQFGLKST